MTALLKAALAELAAADALAASETARAEAFRADADAARQASANLERAAAEREGAALAAGEPMPDAPYAETRNREKAERTARAADVAARKISDALAGPIAARQASARAAVVAASITASRSIRDEARADFHTALEAMSGPLASMIAGQLLRDRLAGESFDFDSAIHPAGELWDAATVARKFVQSLPPRLRPEGFSDRVEKDATARLDAILAELEPSL